jgi:hypothetical protein
MFALKLVIFRVMLSSADILSMHNLMSSSDPHTIYHTISGHKKAIKAPLFGPSVVKEARYCCTVLLVHPSSPHPWSVSYRITPIHLQSGPLILVPDPPPPCFLNWS